MRTVLLLCLLSCTAPTFAQPDVSALDPANWLGPMPADCGADVRALQPSLKEAMNQRDSERIADIIKQMKTAMGKYVGVPEKKVDRVEPVNTSPPDMARVNAVWQDALKRMQDNFPWDIARRATGPEGTGQPRVREHAELARGYLAAAEARVENAPAFLQRATEALDFLLTIQGSNGCFGYPYDLKSEHRLRAAGRQLAERGRASGVNVVENGWIINDFDGGELQYTNGHGGLAMLYGYLVTGDSRYRAAGVRSAEYALPLSLCTNFNYNAFSVWILARAYRVTGDQRFLTAAIDKTRFGVLPGQLENGRWFDPHNALPWYHNIIMWGCVELCLACKEAGDPYLDTIEKNTVIGIDGLALEITSFGMRSISGLRTLAFASMALGPRDTWEKAINVCVNHMCRPEVVEDFFKQPLDEIFAGTAGIPSSLGFYILYTESRAGRAYSCEIDVGRRLKELEQIKLRKQ